MKCFQNDIIMYNNYPHLYIIVWYVMEKKHHYKNHGFFNASFFLPNCNLPHHPSKNYHRLHDFMVLVWLFTIKISIIKGNHNIHFMHVKKNYPCDCKYNLNWFHLFNMGELGLIEINTFKFWEYFGCQMSFMPCHKTINIILILKIHLQLIGLWPLEEK